MNSRRRNVAPVPGGVPSSANLTGSGLIRYAKGAEDRKVSAGGKRLPGGVLSPEAARALMHLCGAGYAPSLMKSIERALIEASERV